MTATDLLKVGGADSTGASPRQGRAMKRSHDTVKRPAGKIDPHLSATTRLPSGTIAKRETGLAARLRRHLILQGAWQATERSNSVDAAPLDEPALSAPIRGLLGLFRRLLARSSSIGARTSRSTAAAVPTSR